MCWLMPALADPTLPSEHLPSGTTKTRQPLLSTRIERPEHRPTALHGFQLPATRLNYCRSPESARPQIANGFIRESWRPRSCALRTADLGDGRLPQNPSNCRERRDPSRPERMLVRPLAHDRSARETRCRAFGLTMAVGRYDQRRAAVVDDANAIGTTYLRAQTLREPLAPAPWKRSRATQMP